MNKTNKEIQRKIDEVHLLLQKEKMKAATNLLNELIEKRPSDPNVLLLLGIAALRQKDYELAQTYLQNAISQDNQLSEAHYNLATLYVEREEYDKAIEEYQKMSSLAASYAAQMNLALAFEHNWRFLEAKIIYESLLEQYPEDTNIYLHLGNVLVKLLNIKGAIAIYERGLMLAPKSIDLLNHLGVALFKDHQLQRSAKCFHKVLAMKPDNVQALFQLSQQHPFKDESFPETKALQEILSSNNANVDDQALCHFALGRIYDVSDFYERAFFHYEKANSLCAKLGHYDENDVINKMNRIKSLFDSKTIQQKALLSDAKPVFIVGMSGEGKQLLAKTLAMHPQVGMLSQQRLLSHELNKMITDPDLLLNANSATLKQIANNYLETVAKLAPNFQLVCDAAPDNFFILGLIAILFPKAPIIHCTRHPMDLCLANYFHDGKENRYAHHLTTLGRYYQHYAKLMSYWQSIGIANRIEVKYEELIENPTQTIKVLFQALHIDNPNPSLPRLHSDEIDRWKKYQHFLQPLIEVLYET